MERGQESWRRGKRVGEGAQEPTHPTSRPAHTNHYWTPRACDAGVEWAGTRAPGSAPTPPTPPTLLDARAWQPRLSGAPHSTCLPPSLAPPTTTRCWMPSPKHRPSRPAAPSSSLSRPIFCSLAAFLRSSFCGWLSTGPTARTSCYCPGRPQASTCWHCWRCTALTPPLWVSTCARWPAAPSALPAA